MRHFLVNPFHVVKRVFLSQSVRRFSGASSINASEELQETINEEKRRALEKDFREKSYKTEDDGKDGYKLQIERTVDAEGNTVNPNSDNEFLIDKRMEEYLKQIDAHLALNPEELPLMTKEGTASNKLSLEQVRFDVETLRKYGVVPKAGVGCEVESNSMYFTFKSFDQPLLHSFCQRLAQKSIALGVDCFSIVPLPTKIRRWTVLSSPFADKEARTQFEMKTHNRLVLVKALTQENTLYPRNMEHWVAMARVHRLIDIFLRFIPGIQVTFHHKITRKV